MIDSLENKSSVNEKEFGEVDSRLICLSNNDRCILFTDGIEKNKIVLSYLSTDENSVSNPIFEQ